MTSSIIETMMNIRTTSMSMKTVMKNIIYIIIIIIIKLYFQSTAHR